MSVCPIWGNPAMIEGQPDAQRVVSPRADGGYRISGTALKMLKDQSPPVRARLTTWIVDQHRSGESVPFISSDVVKAAQEARPIRIGARRDRLFLALATENPTPGWRFEIGGQVTTESMRYKNRLMAWTESAADADLSKLISMLAEEGYFKVEGILEKIFLTNKGFEHLEALESSNVNSRQAFVAMWFDDSMNEAASAIEEAVRDAGYEPLIISNKEHNGDINDAIISEIRRSRFVVADFTCGTVGADQDKTGVPRGGVYFEAGFAKGLGLEVIWSCRKDCMAFVHFDTNHISHVVWADPTDLRERLTRRIGAIMGYTGDARVKPPAA